jgi:hypothetical protein
MIEKIIIECMAFEMNNKKTPTLIVVSKKQYKKFKNNLKKSFNHNDRIHKNIALRIRGVLIISSNEIKSKNFLVR